MRRSRLSAAVFIAALTVAGAASAQPAGAGAGIRQACAADQQKFCPTATPGPGGGMRECMRAHANDLSQACKNAITQAMAARQQSQGGAPAGGAH